MNEHSRVKRSVVPVPCGYARDGSARTHHQPAGHFGKPRVARWSSLHRPESPHDAMQRSFGRSSNHQNRAVPLDFPNLLLPNRADRRTPRFGKNYRDGDGNKHAHPPQLGAILPALRRLSQLSSSLLNGENTRGAPNRRRCLTTTQRRRGKRSVCDSTSKFGFQSKENGVGLKPELDSPYGHHHSIVLGFSRHVKTSASQQRKSLFKGRLNQERPALPSPEELTRHKAHYHRLNAVA